MYFLANFTSNIDFSKFFLGIFGGWLLGVKSLSGLAFYDWDSLDLIRRIEIQPRHVFWSESGELVCLATDESYFILRFDATAVASAREYGEFPADGVDEAFEVISVNLMINYFSYS